MRISDWSSDVCSSDLSFFANRSRPCLLYQIKRCSAPCVDRISKEEYAELVSDAQDFLEGRSTAVQKRLGDAMTRAAEAMDYELAAVLRDRLKALTFIPGSQSVHANGLGNADVFALAAKGGALCFEETGRASGRERASQEV